MIENLCVFKQLIHMADHNHGRSVSDHCFHTRCLSFLLFLSDETKQILNAGRTRQGWKGDH